MDNENVNSNPKNEGYRRDNAASLSSMPHFNYNDENSNVAKAIQKNRSNRTYQKPSYNNESDEEQSQENVNNINQEENVEEENIEEQQNELEQSNLENNEQETKNDEFTKFAEELKAKAKKKIKALIIAALPAIGSFLLFILILSMFLLPVIYLNQYIDKIKTGAQEFGDKALNFLTFNGWETSSSVYTNRLNTISNEYATKLHEDGSVFDVSIINSTIFALKTSNPLLSMPMLLASLL